MRKLFKRILNYLDPRPRRTLYTFVWFNNFSPSAMRRWTNVKWSKRQMRSKSLNWLKAKGWIVNKILVLTEQEYNTRGRCAHLVHVSFYKI